MIQTLMRNWWLLALCGLLDGTISVIYLVMQRTNGPVVSGTWGGTVVLVGKLAMAAGACAIAAGLWKSDNGKSWALVLNGVALASLGFIQYGLTRFPVSILAIAVLIVVISLSLGSVEFALARVFRNQGSRADYRLFAVAAILSVAFVLPSLALGLRWVRLQPGSHLDLLWLGSYFGFAALCMIVSAARLHQREPFLSRPAQP